MNKSGHPSRIAASLLLAVSAAMSLPAAAQPAPAAHNMHDMKNMPAGAHGSMDMKGMMKQMNDEMAAMPMSGDTDIDFAMMMRVHHVGAIDMAKAELADGRNPQMRKLAADIIMAQNREIAIIDKFLAKKGRPVKK